jgi:hypothetical protein
LSRKLRKQKFLSREFNFLSKKESTSFQEKKFSWKEVQHFFPSFLISLPGNLQRKSEWFPYCPKGSFTVFFGSLCSRGAPRGVKDEKLHGFTASRSL